MQTQTKSAATATHCPYCAFQCGMSISLSSGQPEVAGDLKFPVNRGALCVKGWTSVETLAHPDRLLTPLIRAADGELKPASWEAALDRVVEGIRSAQEKYGADAIGVFGGGSLTNEKAYLLGKFARVALQTPNIDYNGRFCMSSAAAASIRAFGVDRGLPFPVEDIAGAETILLVGSNAAETMPPIMQYFDKSQVLRRKPDCCRPTSVPDSAASQTPPPAHARDRRRPGKRPPPRAHGGGADRRVVHTRAHRRLRSGEGRRGLLLAGARGAHYGNPGTEDSAGGANPRQRALGNGTDRERRGAAGSGRKQHAVLHQHRACPWPRRQAVQRLRLPYRAGQRFQGRIRRCPATWLVLSLTGMTGRNPDIARISWDLKVSTGEA